MLELIAQQLYLKKYINECITTCSFSDFRDKMKDMYVWETKETKVETIWKEVTQLCMAKLSDIAGCYGRWCEKCEKVRDSSILYIALLVAHCGSAASLKGPSMSQHALCMCQSMSVYMYYLYILYVFAKFAIQKSEIVGCQWCLLVQQQTLLSLWSLVALLSVIAV
jgi:hypothetical protein